MTQVNAHFAIIDVETTGGEPTRERITEIAIYRHDGNGVIDEFVSLINPERPIPAFISRLTGITDRMVENAPYFYEVAKRIVEITDNAIFVAHNASFDYHFVKAEFQRLEYTYKRDMLDTVKESRRLLPGFPSYSLGKLTQNIGIELNNRHRASGDALATVKLFELLLQKDPHLAEPGFANLHAQLDRKKISNLPDETGVYYFYNPQQELLYIGKSKTIRSRIHSHLRNESTARANRMRSEIADVDYELTGSELVALLKESEEIKALNPKYNRAQRAVKLNYGLYKSYDENGYLCLHIEKKQSRKPALAEYKSAQSAQKHLRGLAEEFHLCQKLTGLDSSSGACFAYKLHRCKGACIGKEPPEYYNRRAALAVETFAMRSKDFLIADQGRHNDEKAFILVENGKYKGYGYANPEYLNDMELVRDAVQPGADNREVRNIIHHYIAEHKAEKLIYLRNKNQPTQQSLF